MKREILHVPMTPTNQTGPLRGDFWSDNAASVSSKGVLETLQAEWKLLTYATLGFVIEHLLHTALLTGPDRVAALTTPNLAARIVWALAEGAAVTYVISRIRKQPSPAASSLTKESTPQRAGQSNAPIISPKEPSVAESESPLPFVDEDRPKPPHEEDNAVEACFFDFSDDPAPAADIESMEFLEDRLPEAELESCDAPHEEDLSDIEIVASLAKGLIEPTETFRRSVKELHAEIDLLLAEFSALGRLDPITEEQLLALKRLPKALTDMLGNAERMENVVTAMRQASRVPSPPGTIDVNKAVLQSVTAMKATWHDCALVEFSLQDDLNTLEADEAQFKRALRELMLNAVDAIRESKPKRMGLIRVSTTCNRLREIHVRIEDDGIGMTTDNLRRAFEPGFSTKSGRPGQGLGTAREAMGRCGGRIAVGSAFGKGAAFEMRFPRPNEVLVQDKRLGQLNPHHRAKATDRRLLSQITTPN